MSYPYELKLKHTRNKQIQNAYQQFKKSNYTELSQCYKNFSKLKKYEMEDCIELYYLLGGKQYGESLKILSYNKACFAVGFIGLYLDKPTFFYITRKFKRFIYLDELIIMSTHNLAQSAPYIFNSICEKYVSYYNVITPLDLKTKYITITYNGVEGYSKIRIDTTEFKPTPLVELVEYRNNMREVIYKLSRDKTHYQLIHKTA